MKKFLAIVLIMFSVAGLRASVITVGNSVYSISTSLSPITSTLYSIKGTVSKSGGSSGYLRLCLVVDGTVIQYGVYQGADGGTFSQGINTAKYANGTHTLLLQQYIEGTAVATTWTFQGSGSITEQQEAPFRKLSFSLQNSGNLWRFAGVFSTENPGVMQFMTRVEPGATQTFNMTVKSSDGNHYYAAFVDAEKSTNAMEVSPSVNDGTERVYYTGVTPDSTGATTVQTGLTSSVTATTNTDPTYPYVSTPGGGFTNPIIAGSGTTTSGGSGAATDAQLSVVGNAINKTLTDNAKALQTTIINGNNSIASGLESVQGGLGTVGTKIDGVQTGMGSLGGKIDGVKSSVDAVSGKIDGISTALDNIDKKLSGDDKYDVPGNVAAARTAADGIEAYNGAKPSGPGVNVTVPTSGSGETFGTVNVGGQSLRFGVSGGIGGTDSLMRLARPVLLIAICIGFLRTISGHVTTYTAALPQVQAQDTNTGPENLVPGVSQAKTMATAAASVVVVFAGAASIVALADTMVTYYGGGIATIFQAIDVPGSGPVGAIDAVFPMAPALALTVMSASAPFLMAPVFLASAAILRFMKT